nr:MAG TPA: hypothetical protein [Caudoviricetes sp.]
MQSNRHRHLQGKPKKPHMMADARLWNIKKQKIQKRRLPRKKMLWYWKMNHAAYHIPVLVQWIRRNQLQRPHRLQSCFYLQTCRSSREPESR